jgi:protein O-mannosyl-transferase
VGKASRQKRERSQPAPEVKDTHQRFDWWLAAALCLVAFLAYAQTLSFDFVYDDDIQVLRNPWIRDLSQVGNFFFTDVWRFSTEIGGNYYRPFHMLAHAIGYALSGLNPLGFHLINILLHCGNTLLLAFIGYRLAHDRLVSAAGALLFALHPVHAESVAWIAGITDPLCAVFYFGALFLYLNRDPLKSGKAGVLGSLLFLGALFSKEMAFTLPFIVLWSDICLGRKLRWKQYALMIAMFGIYSAFRVHALSQFQVSQMPFKWDFYERFLSSVVLIGQYITKAFIPFDIVAFHVFRPTMTLLDPRFFLNSLSLFVFAFGAWQFRRDRRILFLFGFIPVALLPVLNINGIAANVFADRYLYIPSLGSCLMIPMIAQSIWKWRPERFRVSGTKLAAGFLGGLSLVFAFMLWRTSSIWRDNLTLYSETLKRSPDAAPMSGNLARYYFEKGQIKEAKYWLSRTLDIWERSFIKNPGELLDNYVRLSAIDIQEGKLDNALQSLEKAYQIDPKHAPVSQNLGIVFLMMKDYAKARKWFETSLAINPRNEIGYNNLAYISLQEQKPDQVIEYALKALEIFPKYGDAYLNLARGYAAKGLSEQASEAYRNAKLNNPLLQSVIDQELAALEAGTKIK